MKDADDAYKNATFKFMVELAKKGRNVVRAHRSDCGLVFFSG
jgi:hypothetical protein